MLTPVCGVSNFTTYICFMIVLQYMFIEEYGSTINNEDKRILNEKKC